MYNPTKIVSVVAAAMVLAGAATADIIEFTFEGTLSSVAGTSIVPELTNPQVGQDLIVRYRFDSDAEDLNGSSSKGQWPILAYEVTVGAATFDVATGDAGILLLTSSPSHRYFASAETFFDTRGEILQQLSVALEDTTSTAFADDSLPLDLSLDDFDTAEFNYREIDKFLLGAPFEMEGTFDAFASRIVPSPGAGVMVLLAIGLGIQRRPRR